MGNGPFPEVKRPGRGVDHPPSSSAEVKQRVELYLYTSVSQTVVRGPQVVLRFCPCDPFRLNISQKKDRKNKINVNCVSYTIVENLKQSLEITYNKRL